jgi:hypothetical protein
MKTSVMNGDNISKLDFNYMISYRPTHSPKFEKMEEQVKSLFQEIPFNHLIYFWEKDSQVMRYHSHILILSDFEEILPKMFRNIEGYNSIYNGHRETILKTKKSFVNHQTEERICKFIDKVVVVSYSELRGKRGKVYIEPVLDKRNSSYYVSKYSDRGLISGYINDCFSDKLN